MRERPARIAEKINEQLQNSRFKATENNLEFSQSKATKKILGDFKLNIKTYANPDY